MVKQILLHLALLFLIVSCATHLAGTSSDVDIKTGMIVGTLVNSSGATLGDAQVELFKTTSVDSAGELLETVYTDSVGRYLFTPQKSGLYQITGAYNDSLFATRLAIEHDEEMITDLAKDTLRAPGTISGTVVFDQENRMGVAVYIPGTSYTAFSDSSGDFTMFNVAPGHDYSLAFQKEGYATIVLNTVSVEPEKMTKLDTISLVRNSYPLNVTAQFDSSSGTVTIRWSPQEREDIAGYVVYYKDSTHTAEYPIQIEMAQLCTDTFYVDTLSEELFSRSDTITLQYQVQSVNSHENRSPFSNKAFVNAFSTRDSSTVKTISLLSTSLNSSYFGGESGSVKWNYTGLIDQVNILFTHDNGTSWYPAAYLQDNSGIFPFILPKINSDSCRIRIASAEDLTLFDESELFSIITDDSVNLIANGTFDQALSYWSFVLWNGATGTAEVNRGACELNVLTLPDLPWHYAFYQDEIALQKGKRYRIELDAMSSLEGHQIQFALQNSEGEFETYGVVDTTLTTQMKRYSMEIQMAHEDNLNGLFLITPGFEAEKVTIDNVSLYVVSK